MLVSAILADACLFFIVVFFEWRYPEESITQALCKVWVYGTLMLFILIIYNFLLAAYAIGSI